MIRGLYLTEINRYGELLDWAVRRWKIEVEQRPLENVHRRTLDETWRQVIRFAGGDPDELVGTDHDTLLRDPFYKLKQRS